MSILPRIFVGLWIICGTYLGAAGWSRMELDQPITVAQGPVGKVVCGDGIILNNMEACLRYRRDKQIASLFPWITKIPELFGMLLVGFGFGCVGGAIRLYADMLVTKSALTALRGLDVPLFGGMLGIMVLGVVYLVPAILVERGFDIRPASLLFFSLLSGAFYNKVYSWVEHQLDAVFPPRKPKEEEADDAHIDGNADSVSDRSRHG